MSINKQTDENKAKLSNEQKQKIKKYAVFALMGVIFSGCMWYLFAPSADEKAKKEQTSGFNSEVPLPKEEGLFGDKRDAYEQDQMKQRQAERMRSLDDFSSLLGETGKKQSGDLALLPEESSSDKAGGGTYQTKSASIQSSMNAYQDINRSLGNFYEKPKEDPEKERLKQELEELKLRMDEAENRKNSVDEQMELMERSFQMASKYAPTNPSMNPAMNATTSSPAEQTANTSPKTNTSGKTAVVPVSGFVEQTVSALPQEMSDKEVIQALSKPRNLGFFTAINEVSTERKNTIFACVHDDQTVMDGESVRLRLLEPMRAGKIFIYENTILSGFSKIQSERLQITITSLEYNGSIIPVDITVYDTDGQRGIYIPYTKELSAAKEIVANLGTNAGTSINLSNDAGEQFVADMGRNVIQGISQFASKKLREVKINLKAGYCIFLLPEGSTNNQYASNQ